MIRTAIIGCGRHTKSTLVNYLKLLTDIDFQASVDLIKQSANEVQVLLGTKMALDSIYDLDTSNLDFGIIALPPSAAYEAAKFLIDKGIPCFIEKPPAPSSQQIKELDILSVKNKVLVQIGFNFRFSNAIMAIKQATQDEIIALTAIDFKSKHPSTAEWGVADPCEAWLRHNGVHAFDLLRYFCGDIVEVNARLTSNHDGRFLILSQNLHKNGTLSVLRLGNLTGSFDISADLLNMSGSRIYMPNLHCVNMATNTGHLSEYVIYKTKNLDTAWATSGYGSELASCINSIKTKSVASPSLEDAYKASQICDSILMSINKKRIVEVADD